MADSSNENMEARKQWNKIWRRITANLESYIQLKYPFKGEGKIKTFSDTQKLVGI